MNQIISQGAIIIDVRTQGEFAGGNIKGSKNIPLEAISSQVDQIKKFNKPVITVCRSGNRSGIAKSILSNAGVEAYNGGAWNNLQTQIS